MHRNRRCQIRRIECRRFAKEDEMRFGTWNLKTIMSKEAEITREMERYKIQVLRISEVKKKGNGEMKLEKVCVLRYSGVRKIRRAK
jgi:hypothetical protein